MNVEVVYRRANEILDEVERAIVGKRDALELVFLGMLADGHVLIEDFPGLAKTMIARAFAQVTSIGFTRVQFTPDLMPSDVTGASIYNQREAEPPQRPRQLERLERELTMASSTAFDLHARLRPQLREIAELRLATRGVRLEDGEGVLGEELWDLVRPDRPPPSNRHAEGIPPAELRRAIEVLEAL